MSTEIASRSPAERDHWCPQTQRFHATPSDECYDVRFCSHVFEESAETERRVRADIASRERIEVLDHVIRLAEREYGATVRTWQGARRNLFAQRGRGARRMEQAYEGLILAGRRMRIARLRMRVLESRRGQLARRREAVAA